MLFTECNVCCKCHPYFFSHLQTCLVKLSFTPITCNVQLCGLSELPAQRLGCSETSQQSNGELVAALPWVPAANSWQ